MKYPYLVKNFFTKNEMLDLKSHIKNLINKSQDVKIESLTWDQIYVNTRELMVDKWFGRVQLTLPPEEYPEHLVKKLSWAGKVLDPNCYIKYISFARYSLEYGYPQLVPHMDSPNKEAFLFDIQLESNIEWPIMVDNKEYILKDNWVLAIDVQRQVHWRKPTKFEKDNYVEMLFVSFENNELELPIESEQMKKSQMYNEEYYAKMQEEYPDYTYEQRLPLKD